MSIEWLREFCLSLPHTTETLQWQDALVFKVGGKMYAVARLDPGEHWLALKCGDEEYLDLIERPGISPAPYLARAHWIALESETTVRRAELEDLLSRGYTLVLKKLPKKHRAELAAPKRKAKPKSKPKRRGNPPR
jgi:predicted DNA-binding protein (MmcQ/YjbR family)